MSSSRNKAAPKPRSSISASLTGKITKPSSSSTSQKPKKAPSPAKAKSTSSDGNGLNVYAYNSLHKKAIKEMFVSLSPLRAGL